MRYHIAVSLLILAATGCGVNFPNHSTKTVATVLVAPIGITLDALNSCARNPHRIVIKPTQPDKRPPEPEPLLLRDLRAGQEGWITGIYSYHDRLMVNPSTDVIDRRGLGYHTLIRVESTGILVSCTPSPQVVIWDEDPGFDPKYYPPIVGMFNPAKGERDALRDHAGGEKE